jgi:hypothetical protein
MARENGVTAAVDAFHAHLPRARMACDFLPNQPAALVLAKDKREIKMCKPIASLLLKNHKIARKQIETYGWDEIFSLLRLIHLTDTAPNRSQSRIRVGIPSPQFHQLQYQHFSN